MGGRRSGLGFALFDRHEEAGTRETGVIRKQGNWVKIKSDAIGRVAPPTQ